MNEQRRVEWWEPPKASRQEFIADLKKTHILEVRVWFRILLVSTVIAAALIAWISHYYPSVAIPWRHIFAIIPAMMCILSLHVGLLALVPRHVQVRREFIQVTHGQHALRIKREAVQGIALIEDITPNQLIICHESKRGKQRTAAVHVRESVDRSILLSLLQSYPAYEHIAGASDTLSHIQRD